MSDAYPASPHYIIGQMRKALEADAVLKRLDRF
jgi:hypothetical protein